jgi:hypothetical protein
MDDPKPEVPVAEDPLELAAKRCKGYALKVWPGAEMTEPEIEFATAVERYKRRYRRPFPSASEVLAVLISLGYRRV